ncbi:MAG: excinuclease ABC subunit UvrC, partial [Spirochaetales bacterium]|nr:excinuclease ABC subunit UvrC [Spirochaetales bacterium]
MAGQSKDELKEKVRNFPLSSGVYIMKNSRKEVIYVGKAKVLRNRVSSYFNGKKEGKTALLVSRIATIDYVETDNEFEALLLENNFIKKWTPRYNILLKDGKSYPAIRITNEDFPRVFRTRHIINDGSRYFGPYPDGMGAVRYMDLINSLFPIRRCQKLTPREHPCLYHHIGKCSAPCCGKISKEDYGKHIKKIASLLSGKTVMLVQELEKDMKTASEELKFEEAARLRDLIRSVELLQADQAVVDFDRQVRDYLVTMSSGNTQVFVVYQLRDGHATGRDVYTTSFMGDDDEALLDFIVQYYSVENRELPKTLYTEGGDRELAENFFADRLNKPVKVRPARSKRDVSVMNMARENCLSELDKKMRKEGDLSSLRELKLALGMKKVPRRIEGFDIAQLHGKYTVASLISFKDGNPDRKNYRHFTMQSLAEGEIDDFKSISEAVARRYSRILNEEGELPDLVMIDGGKGQVSAAWSVFKALGLQGKVALCGLAKKEELIFLPEEKEPVDLPEGDPALRILQQVRDETHRFATSHNQKLRQKELRLS